MGSTWFAICAGLVRVGVEHEQVIQRRRNAGRTRPRRSRAPDRRASRSASSSRRRRPPRPGAHSISGNPERGEAARVGIACWREPGSCRRRARRPADQLSPAIRSEPIAAIRRLSAKASSLVACAPTTAPIALAPCKRLVLRDFRCRLVAAPRPTPSGTSRSPSCISGAASRLSLCSAGNCAAPHRTSSSH